MTIMLKPSSVGALNTFDYTGIIGKNFDPVKIAKKVTVQELIDNVTTLCILVKKNIYYSKKMK